METETETTLGQEEFHKAEQRKHTRQETRPAGKPLPPLHLPPLALQAQSEIYENVTEKPHSTQKSFNFCSGRGNCICLLLPPFIWPASCAPFSFLCVRHKDADFLSRMDAGEVREAGRGKGEGERLCINAKYMQKAQTVRAMKI